jgi:hypothetical protein
MSFLLPCSRINLPVTGSVDIIAKLLKILAKYLSNLCCLTYNEDEIAIQITPKELSSHD